jgi:adenylylsulfate kinase
MAYTAESFVIWFYGLPSSGKTSLATAVMEQMKHKGMPIVLLDGDTMRQGLCKDLGVL